MIPMVLTQTRPCHSSKKVKLQILQSKRKILFSVANDSIRLNSLDWLDIDNSHIKRKKE